MKKEKLSKIALECHDLINWLESNIIGMPQEYKVVAKQLTDDLKNAVSKNGDKLFCGYYPLSEHITQAEYKIDSIFARIEESKQELDLDATPEPIIMELKEKLSSISTKVNELIEEK